MKAGIIQSCYIPWRGYFDFIASVDVFVLFDDVSFGSRGSWRHRNALRFGSETRWLTVPVSGGSSTPIDEVRIAGDEWIPAHRELLRRSLSDAPYFADAERLWEDAVGANDATLSELNARFIRSACGYLGIGTRILDARPLGGAGAKTERLISVLRALGADAYLSGPAAKAYIDEDLFRRARIALEYKTYDYEPYPQRGEGFTGAVSVLDLIANAGPGSRRLLASRAPNEVVCRI